MKKITLSFVALLSVAIFCGQSVVLPKSTVLPHTTVLTAVPLVHSFTFVQAVDNLTCSSGSSTCVLTPGASTTVGDLLWVGVNPYTTTSRHITGVSCDTFVPLNGLYQIYQSAGGQVDEAWVIVETASCSTITITLSGSGGSAVWYASMMEFSCTASCSTVIMSAAATSSATPTASPIPGVALAISGSSNLCIQQVTSAKNVTAVYSGGYTIPATLPNSISYTAAYKLNTPSCTMSWTTSATGSYAEDAVAYK
jgi:hypothetical protein